jgi:hypothetical protein
LEPLRILGYEIKQDIAVDQDRSHLLISSQSHDLIGAHSDVSTSAQVRNKP